MLVPLQGGPERVVVGVFLMDDTAVDGTQHVVVEYVVDAKPESRLVVCDARAESRRNVCIGKVVAYLPVCIGLRRIVEVSADNDSSRYAVGDLTYETGLLGPFRSCSFEFSQ